MFVAGINVKMFTATSTIFFEIQFVKKTNCEGQKVNPINNAPISNLMTDLESLYTFLSEYMF